MIRSEKEKQGEMGVERNKAASLPEIAAAGPHLNSSHMPDTYSTFSLGGP